MYVIEEITHYLVTELSFDGFAAYAYDKTP